MKLSILNIDEFIKKNDVKKVNNTMLPSERDGYVKDSLFGENIFGAITSKERQIKFGYIDLKQPMIHPAAYAIIKSSSEVLSRIINKREKYVFLEKEKIFKAVENGETGISFLIKNFNKIKFSKIAKKDKINEAEFLDKNKKSILITKWLVIPAGIRDINISKFSSVRISSEVNDLYSTLFYLTKQSYSDIITEKLQNSIMSIYNWLKNDLRGKNGLMRGKMLKKSLDYSSRLVLVSSPEIDLGKVGLPWHVLLAIYKPFFIHFIHYKNKNLLETIKMFLKKDEIDFNDTDKLLTELHKNPNTFPEDLKNIIIKSISDVIKDQIVICKRDPVLDRSSWFAAEPELTSGITAVVNSLDLNPIGGDCVLGDILVHTDNNNFKIVDIANFNKIFKCTKEYVNTNKNGVIVEKYFVNDNVYSYGISLATGKIDFNKIVNWYIHKNLNIYKLSTNRIHCITPIKDLIVSENGSLLVYNRKNQNIEESTPQNVIKYKNDLSLIRLKNIENLSDNINEITEKHENSDISETAKNILQYQKNEFLELIPCEYLTIEKCNETTAYDITIDNNQQSFINKDGVLLKNCDGDTIEIVPLFSEEAKKIAKEKMHPKYSKTKLFDTVNYDTPNYKFTLDQISTIYNATK